jgi:hypothetical protein
VLVCELAWEQADSLREEIEERAYGRYHSAPRWENGVHNPDVNLERRQEANERAGLQILGNEKMRHKGRADPLQRRVPQCREIVRAETWRMG